jgi:hypothetical protein
MLDDVLKKILACIALCAMPLEDAAGCVFSELFVVNNHTHMVRGVARGSPGGLGTTPSFGPQTPIPHKKLGPNR